MYCEHCPGSCLACGGPGDLTEAVDILRRICAAWDGKSGRLADAVNQAEQYLEIYDDESVLNAAD